MDSEASAEMKESMKKYEIRYQLVPTPMHLWNATEQDIWAFKNHFLDVLIITDPGFSSVNLTSSFTKQLSH